MDASVSESMLRTKCYNYKMQQLATYSIVSRPVDKVC